MLLAAPTKCSGRADVNLLGRHGRVSQLARVTDDCRQSGDRQRHSAAKMRGVATPFQ